MGTAADLASTDQPTQNSFDFPWWAQEMGMTKEEYWSGLHETEEDQCGAAAPSIQARKVTQVGITHKQTVGEFIGLPRALNCKLCCCPCCRFRLGQHCILVACTVPSLMLQLILEFVLIRQASHRALSCNLRQLNGVFCYGGAACA